MAPRARTVLAFALRISWSFADHGCELDIGAYMQHVRTDVCAARKRLTQQTDVSDRRVPVFRLQYIPILQFCQLQFA